ncbi:hypothetical protein [Caldimonas sp. KR1-144]|uniref:hypothetical protein n=1 Tax=Caldimonas sp. KR1-144 TaxID=3400911 RepID=UPI003C0EF545
MRDYGRVHSAFWSSESVARLSDDGKLLALYLMTCSHNTIAGVFRLPDGYVAEDTKWTPERVAKGFAELLENGFATRCDRTNWVWIFKHLEWNPPENPNQRKAAAKVVHQVPRNCAWRADFLAEKGWAVGLEPEPLDPSETVSKPLPNPVANQEQEQEQEQEQKQDQEQEQTFGLVGDAADQGGPKRPTVPCPYDAIVDAYHRLLPELPKVRLRDGPTWKGRQKVMRDFWGWVLSSRKSDGTRRAETAEQALAWIDQYFSRARDNDFVMGRTPRGAGHENWKPDVEYLLSARGMKQVIEKTQEAAA